jgi:hypothetical protein
MQRYVTLSLLAIAACTKVSSGDLTTKGISADYRVTAQSNGGVEASAILRQGEIDSLSFVEVKGSDKLLVSVGQNEKQMTKIELLNVVSYGASFSGENVEGNDFSFAFTRSVDAGAPRSSCQLPKPFEITQPLNEPSYKRSLDNIVVLYNNPGTTDLVRYKLTGSCIKDKEVALTDGDGGTFEVTKDQLEPINDERKNDPCDVTITVMRSRKGSLDTGFGKGGKIECMQERKVKFRSEP